MFADIRDALGAYLAKDIELKEELYALNLEWKDLDIFQKSVFVANRNKNPRVLTSPREVEDAARRRYTNCLRSFNQNKGKDLERPDPSTFDSPEIFCP